MRTILSMLLLAGMLAGVLGGCLSPEEPEADGGESLQSTLANAEQIDYYGSDGSLLRTLNSKEEIDEFFDALDLADWSGEEDFTGGSAGRAEERSDAEMSIVFSKRPTETLLGGKPEEDEREELIRLTLYPGSNTADLTMSFFTIQVELPDEVAAALREQANSPS